MRQAVIVTAAANVVFFIANTAWCRAEDQSTDVTSKQELTDDWKQEVDVPEAKSWVKTLKAAKLTLWVEQNWLVVRRDKPNGWRDWEIVFAHVGDKKPPQVLLKDRGAIEINYGRYFIREMLGQMRVFRRSAVAHCFILRSLLRPPALPSRSAASAKISRYASGRRGS